MEGTKQRAVIIALAVALLAAGLYAMSYLPQPVLRDIEAVEEISVRIFTDGRSEELDSFDEQAVLELLGSLEKRRVSTSATQRPTPTVEIHFRGNENGRGFFDRVFLCGEARYCVCGVYGDSYKILDADEAFARICAILEIDAA